jgi:N-acylneuraminate cytidylyltransferase
VIDGRRILAVIPARGGSKGLPGKNIRPLCGKPLIGWTIDAASSTREIDATVVSTDDDEIARIAQACGATVPFRRPAEISDDRASSLDVVMHAVEQLPGFDIVILLQPTSPLRGCADIREAVQLFHRFDAKSVASVCEVDEHPLWMYRVGTDHRLLPLLEIDERPSRRQDLPSVYRLNGAVYIVDLGWARRKNTFVSDETLAYVMPRARSIDIDTEADFLIAEHMMNEELNVI